MRQKCYHRYLLGRGLLKQKHENGEEIFLSVFLQKVQQQKKNAVFEVAAFLLHVIFLVLYKKVVYNISLIMESYGHMGCIVFGKVRKKGSFHDSV